MLLLLGHGAPSGPESAVQTASHPSATPQGNQAVRIKIILRKFVFALFSDFKKEAMIADHTVFGDTAN